MGKSEPVAEKQMSSKQGWVLALAGIASFMISLDSVVVATALTPIKVDLTASLEALEWTVNAYNLSLAGLLLTGAALGDRLGRKRLFAAGLGLFAVASVACALAPGVGWLIAARAFQGAGAALIMPLALTLLTAAFPPERRGKALGIFMGITGLATFSGPFIGGAVSEGIAWQWIFWINVPIAAAVVALTPARVDESFGPDNRVDVGGLVLGSVAAFGLVWALVRGNVVGWGSPEVVGAFAAGVVLTLGFIRWERRVSAPMLPMRLFGIRAFSTANAANFCLFGSLYGTLFFLAQFLQTAQGHGPFGAGLRLMPWTATLMVCAPIAGKLADKLGERRFMSGGLILQMVGLGWLALIVSPDVGYLSMLLPLIISGVGLSMALPAAQKSVVGAVQPMEIGKASGAINTLRMLGGAFGVAILAAVFASTGGYESPQSFSDGFVAAMGVGAAVAAVGALAGLGMPGKRPAVGATPAAGSAVPS